tara:strand:- start:18 stop:374 length:357 start_codon:yes stop_codon:yes gene_type:complete
MTLKILPLTHPLHLVMGFMIWALWLVLIYAGLSLGCMAAASPETLEAQSWLNIALLGFTMIISALLLWIGIRCWRFPPTEENKKQARFILRVSGAVYFCAAIATLAGSIPTLMLPPCL